MKLQQLRFLLAVAEQNLSISAAALHLATSQPGVSKQIRLLEDELGVEIFERKGKRLARITPVGELILARAREIFRQTKYIRHAADEFRDQRRGNLAIATTHTQSRYVLPRVVERFIESYPDVVLSMHQGTPPQIADEVFAGKVDFAIATEGHEHFAELVMVPCYRWNRSVVVPEGHPLSRRRRLRLADLADYPIVTYVFGFTGRSDLDLAFWEAGLKPRIAFTATDTDVIKTYVRLGLGIGIIAGMAFDPAADQGLVALPAGHLFKPSETRIVCLRGAFLRSYAYDFIAMFAPHLNRRTMDAALACDTSGQVEALFENLQLELR